LAKAVGMTPRLELDRIRTRQRIIGAHVTSDPAWEILLDLADAGSLKTSAVGGSTRIPNTTVLRYINMLESRGLVERKSADGDARLTLVSLTDAGQAAVAESLAA
jgi:DNA-binding MarR family transcriptional regulator